MNLLKHLVSNHLYFALIAPSSLFSSYAAADPLVEIRSARIVVEREHTANGSFVVVKIALPKQAEASAFAVQHPPRIVIDIVGTRINKNEALPVASNGVIHQVRLGAHPEKLRVVLDLISEPPNPVDWKTEGRSVIVRLPERSDEAQAVDAPVAAAPILTESPAQKEILPQPTTAISPVKTTLPKTEVAPPNKTQTSIPTPQATPQATPTSTPTPKKSPTQHPIVFIITTAVPIVQTVIPTIQLTVPSAPTVAATKKLLPPPDSGSGIGSVSIDNVPSQNQNNPNSKLLIRGYQFDYLQPGKTPVLKIKLSRDRTQAQISKVDAKTYRIIVPNSGLDSATLALPQFPPADFIGFSMVAAQEVEGQVEITVTVELGTTLGTFVRGNEIWVKRL